MTPVRIGLAGYGRGGRYFHAPLIGRAPECTLAGVLTRSPQRRAELAEDFPGVPAFGRTGTFAVGSDDGQSGRLLSGETAGDGPFGTVPEARWGRIYRGEGVSPQPVPAERGRWSSFYSAFARAVRGAGPLPVDPRDAIAALEVLDAARLSAARGDVVRLS